MLFVVVGWLLMCVVVAFSVWLPCLLCVVGVCVFVVCVFAVCVGSQYLLRVVVVGVCCAVLLCVFGVCDW